MASPKIPSELQPVYDNLEATHQSLVDDYYAAGREDLAIEYLERKFPKKGGLQAMQFERPLSEFDLARAVYGVPEEQAKAAVGKSQIQVALFDSFFTVTVKAMSFENWTHISFINYIGTLFCLYRLYCLNWKD